MYPFEAWFSLDICPGVGVLVHMVAMLLVFKGSPYCSPICDFKGNGGWNFGNSRKTEQHFQIQQYKMITFWMTVNFSIYPSSESESSCHPLWAVLQLVRLASPKSMLFLGKPLVFIEQVGISRTDPLILHETTLPASIHSRAP